MHRGILQDCFPAFAALLAAFGVLAVVIRFSGGRPDWRRVRKLHRCQQGGVQTLAFVLTLPIFVMILMFIVQVSQLMIAIVTVHYASFAAARSASVWIPSHVDDGNQWAGADEDSQGELLPPLAPGTPIGLSEADGRISSSWKCQQIWRAAVLACVSISPSRDIEGLSHSRLLQSDLAAGLKRFYPLFDPLASGNLRLPRRLDNKLAYSMANTWIVLDYVDKNSAPVSGTRTYNPIAHPVVEYYPPEVGWQDPVTVTVYHRFALLPGPGRFMARSLIRDDGYGDVVSHLIHRDTQTGVYTTLLRASTTMTVDGIHSMAPYTFSR